MSTENVQRYLIAYDVVEDPRRDKVAKVLQAHGDRIQYSVFIVDAKPARAIRLGDSLKALIDVTSDSVLVCSLGPIATATARSRFIGRQRPLTGDAPLVL